MQNDVIKRGAFADIVTSGDAWDAVDAMFVRQLQRANTENPEINTPINGDREAKTAFHQLLNSTQKRALFIKFCKGTNFWPRVKGLVGNPPYSFLGPEDAGVLNPAGISRGRANMAKNEGVMPILTTSEIGNGHYSDNFDRRYAVRASETQVQNALFRSLVPGAHVVVDVALPRMKASKRVTILKSALIDNRSVKFPLVGESVTIYLNETLVSTAAEAQKAIVVKRLICKSAFTPVCRIVCRVE